MSQQPATPAGLDPKVLSDAVADVTRRVAALAPQMMEKQAADLESSLKDEFGVQKAFGEVVQKLMADPDKMVEAQGKYAADFGNLWQQYMGALTGQGPKLEPLKDRRFSDEAWSSNPWFDFLSRSYLLTAEHMKNAVAKVENVSPQTSAKAMYYTRQFIDAVSPSNFALTNPQVLRDTPTAAARTCSRASTTCCATSRRARAACASR